MASSSSSNYAVWQRVWEDSQPRISTIRQSLNHERPSTLPVTRVGKLDAELLDQELVQVLKDPLQKALSLVNVRELC
jgi:peroxin-2